MARRMVRELTDQEPVSDIFLAAEKQLRPNRSGNLYLQVELRDRSGSIAARMWNANDRVYRSFNNGDFVRVTGTTQVYQGAMQMIIKEIDRVEDGDVDPADFLHLGPKQIEQLRTRLQEILGEIEDADLAAVAAVIVDDEELMKKLCAAPAAVKKHHAYPGGLLEHVVNVMEVARSVCPHYSEVNRDFVLLGALLHDIGKVDELCYQRDLSYSDEGQLIGHIVIGVSLLEAKLREAAARLGRGLDPETALRLKHLVVSHHGELEYGSPTVPMTAEALLLHHLDNLDAKMHMFRRLLDDELAAKNPWTMFDPGLGRKLFRGTGETKACNSKTNSN